MNTFTRKALYAAIAGVAAIGVASTAKAVNLSADGLGQVLIYPYYTVRNNVSGLPYNTLMSVVNTTGCVKAVKVRFREGRNSVEVLDFNVFLSPYDVWTATIAPGPEVTPHAEGEPSTAGAAISTTDNSCTIPAFQSGVPVPFRTVLFESGDNAVSRTSEGYFEIFEMGVMSGVTAAQSIHGSDGKPACGISEIVAAGNALPATGGLFGGVIIVNPAGGGAFSQAATALANFNPDVGYQNAGGPSPSYTDALPVSNVIQNGFLYSSVWNNGTDAVTAALLGNAITNEYVLDAGTKSQTSWIITMPTKFSYVTPSKSQTAAALPFTQLYLSGKGACEPTYAVVFNREEANPQFVETNDFSPPIPGAPGPVICWEATSINFNNGNIFGSGNKNDLKTDFTNGWSTFAFNNLGISGEPAPVPPVHFMLPQAGQTVIFDLAAATTLTSDVTYFGLPVIGFAAETFQNDAIVIGGKAYLATFGAEFVHHKTTRIEPEPLP